ncbi:hypothetical protein QBE53_06115 [Vallitaleaceae bacterium 9-2]
MASKKMTYETVFELGGKIESSFGKTFKNASKQVNGLQQTSKKAEKSTRGLTDALKLATVAAAGYKAFSSAKQYAEESIDAAKVQIEQETKLATVVRERAKATDEQIESILKLTAVQQNLGIIGDEIQIAGAQQLATFLNQTDSIETLLPAMNNLLAQQKGLNASTGDAVSMGNMFGKVMNGQLGALSKAGISFTEAQEEVLKYGTESERAAMLAQVITDNVGAMNEVMAKTDSGKLQNATNRLGDMQEVIGMKLLPIQAEFYSWFADQIPTMQSLISSFIDKTESGFGKAKNVFSQVKPYITAIINTFKDLAPNIDVIRDQITWLKDVALEGFTNIKAAIGSSSDAISQLPINEVVQKVKDTFILLGQAAKPILEYIITVGLPGIISTGASVIQTVADIYNFIQNNWSTFEPIIYGVVGAITAFKTITLVTKGVMMAYKAVMLVATLATSGFGAAVAFVTSPIGIAVLAIGALIAIGVLVYKNWDKISVWLKKTFTNIKNGVVNIFNGIVDFFKEWGPLILAIITGPFGMAIYAIISNWETIKEFFFNLWLGIQEIFSGIGQWFGEKFIEAVTNIKSAFEGVKEFFTGMFKGVIDIFKGFVNMWISIINNMIEKINGIRIDIPDWISEKLGIGGSIGFNIPKIPQLATGGIVTRSTILEAGEGRESEAILPLSKLQSLLDMPYIGSGGTIIYAPHIEIKGNANETDIERILAEDKARFERWYKAMKAKEKRTKF